MTAYGEPLKRHGSVRGIALKKTFGQHFLRDFKLAHKIVGYVDLDDDTNVLEIGCGDGFLTQVIIQCKLKHLWVFEIDEQWARDVGGRLHDPRLQIFTQDVLKADFGPLAEWGQWALIANLPYNITLPFLRLLHANRALFREGIIMIQEEVAKKIVATRGRGYGFISLFFQHYFEWRVLDKVAPSSFYPPPKVFSRLLHFKPKREVAPIEREPQFWTFVRSCFKQPRRTLKNNLVQAHCPTIAIPADTLALRAQQMSMEELVALFSLVGSSEQT